MMAVFMTAVLYGASKFKRKSARLSAATKRRIVRRACTKAMTPVNKAAKARCPQETGLLKKSIGKRSRVYARPGVIWVGVGPRTNVEGIGPDGKLRKPAKYGPLVEARTHFLERAFEANQKTVQKTAAQEIKAGIKREAARG